MNKVKFILEAHRQDFYTKSHLPLYLRLSSDLTWRSVAIGEGLRSDDYITNCGREIMRLCLRNKHIIYQDKELLIWDKSLPVIDNNSFTYRAKVIRDNIPKSTDFNEMVKVLKKRDNYKENLIIFNVYGRLFLLKKKDDSFTGLNPVIACYMILPPKLGCIGTQCLSTTNSQIFQTISKSWKDHTIHNYTNIRSLL